MNIFRLVRQAWALAAIGVLALITGDAASAQVFTFEGVYGGFDSDGPAGIIHAMDNSYVTVGFKDNDILVVKTDRCGGVLWSNTYDLGGREDAHKIRETPQGEYVIVGEVLENDGDTDAFLLKIRATGTLVWGKTYGSDQSTDAGMDLRVDPANGDIYVAGSTISRVGSYLFDGWIFKTDDDGVQSWSQRYGGNYFDRFSAIELGCDGSVIAVGETQSHADWSGDPLRRDIDVFAVRATMASGAITWSYIYGDRQYDESGNAVVKNGISSFYIAGLRKIALPTGTLEWGLLLEAHCAGGYLADEAYYDKPVPTDEFRAGSFDDIQILPNQNIVVTGVWVEVEPGSAVISRHIPIMEIDALTLNPDWNRLDTAGTFGYGIAIADDNPFDTEWNLAVASSAKAGQFGAADLYLVATDENGTGVCADVESTLVAIDPNVEEREIMPKLNPLPGEVEVTPTLLPYGSYDLPCECEQGIIAPPGGQGLSDYVRPRVKEEDLVAVRAKRVSP